MVQVNRIYLIFNPVHFLVDSSDMKSKGFISLRYDFAIIFKLKTLV